MSSVRMCDVCGTIFSEASEDWSSGTATQFYTDSETGRRRQREAQQDRCGTCNGTPSTVVPRLALAPGDIGYTNPAIEKMEKEAGIINGD
jgi:hypothetical protein